MRLADVECEGKCLGDETNRLVVESSRLNVEAKHLNARTPRLADESKHLNVEAPGLITHPKVTEGINRA